RLLNVLVDQRQQSSRCVVLCSSTVWMCCWLRPMPECVKQLEAGASHPSKPVLCTEISKKNNPFKPVLCTEISKKNKSGRVACPRSANTGAYRQCSSRRNWVNRSNTHDRSRCG